jgi:hypothetical protein
MSVLKCFARTNCVDGGDDGSGVGTGLALRMWVPNPRVRIIPHDARNGGIFSAKFLKYYWNFLSSHHTINL